MEAILEHMSALGWDSCAWTDDNLSSKKLYPKFSFPARSREWVQRLRTSDRSMLLAVCYVQNNFLSRAKEIRHKPYLDTVEEISKRAALSISILDEFCQAAPLSKEMVFNDWCWAWASGDAAIDVELVGLLMDRPANLDVRTGIHSLKVLLDQSALSQPIGRQPEEESKLVEDEFDLFVRQVEYDCQVFETFLKKKMTAQAARDHATIKWKQRCLQQCAVAAQSFLDSCCRIIVWEKKAEKMIAEVMNFRRQIMTKIGVEHASQVPHICYLNCSVLCLIPAHPLKGAIDEQMQSVGLLLQPAFTYNRGKLLLEERQVLDLLQQGNHNLDWTFSVLFREKTDQGSKAHELQWTLCLCFAARPAEECFLGM